MCITTLKFEWEHDFFFFFFFLRKSIIKFEEKGINKHHLPLLDTVATTLMCWKNNMMMMISTCGFITTSSWEPIIIHKPVIIPPPLNLQHLQIKSLSFYCLPWLAPPCVCSSWRWNLESNGVGGWGKKKYTHELRVYR